MRKGKLLTTSRGVTANSAPCPGAGQPNKLYAIYLFSKHSTSESFPTTVATPHQPENPVPAGKCAGILHRSAFIITKPVRAFLEQPTRGPCDTSQKVKAALHWDPSHLICFFTVSSSSSSPYSFRILSPYLCFPHHLTLLDSPASVSCPLRLTPFSSTSSP